MALKESMIRQPLFLMVLFLTTTVFGQQYLTADIRAIADSNLRQNVGDTLFYKYCKYDTGSYYVYKNVFGESKWETLYKTTKTRGTLDYVSMSWDMVIPYSKCPAYDTIKGIICIEFDSLLRPLWKPNLNFIPDFYLSQDSCNLICRAEAISIASHLMLQKGIDELRVYFMYDPKLKEFEWYFRQTIREFIDSFGHKVVETECVSIDAVTGREKHHDVIYLNY